ncbi:hypothetical protein CBM2592_B40392 [Cupriavidus taiwanensis]|nr:hypothetical protein CBM2592_B40392 [Cupriavidus taiwanensis]SOY72254.1 hypothetical protein CBM2588_B40209 [Cupriavidus taiwanensis]SOY95819.1 hypothetical protein CBM2591_B20390 [Cupriavidus taiwanensis]SOZ30185.1 hypothetical protein CBM2608_B30414 [Cupriavidus taiwanensis]SOZ75034.1 hypothetical protein CBM2617_B60308 [Cupriavidus taiwanensis]
MPRPDGCVSARMRPGCPVSIEVKVEGAFATSLPSALASSRPISVAKLLFPFSYVYT